MKARLQEQTVGLLVCLIASSVGYAQGNQEAVDSGTQSEGSLLEVVVTARKRDESLLEVPVAVSSISAAELESSGVKGLEDIAKSVPGIQYSDQGGQFPGRFDSAIRFRGMNVNSSQPTSQLGALFLDGIYVLGGTHSLPVDNLERVEVIRGPQAAYFGRNTLHARHR